jgi:hypothetical protein
MSDKAIAKLGEIIKRDDQEQLPKLPIYNPMLITPIQPYTVYLSADEK